MPQYRLTEKQQAMLRAIAPGLEAGTVGSTLVFQTGDNRISAIADFPRGTDESWRSAWKTVTESDLSIFVKYGFLMPNPAGRYTYDLHTQLIIDAVNSHFGDAVESKPAKTEIGKAEDPRRVFVVHGRDDKARDAMFTFLRSIGLLPIEWSQAVAMTGKTSPYIGEVLETAFRQAQAVIVLMTPDDEARLRPPYQKSNSPPRRGPMCFSRQEWQWATTLTERSWWSWEKFALLAMSGGAMLSGWAIVFQNDRNLLRA